ncbi:MAG: H-NS histone family protein [Magnetococcus sp. YQC-3]
MAREKKTEAAAVAPKPAAAAENTQKAQSPYADMPLDELLNLKDDLEKLIKQKQKSQRKEVYAKMSELAKAAGYSSVDEFVASQGGKTRAPRADKGVKMPPKYRSKDGTSTWSGKGRKPGWIVDHLAAGGKLEALEIK